MVARCNDEFAGCARSSRPRCSAAGPNDAIAEATSASREAARLYRLAAAEWQRFGNVFEQGFALLGEGRCLVAAGDRAAAAEPLTRAGEIFRRLGAGPLVGEIDALQR